MVSVDVKHHVYLLTYVKPWPSFDTQCQRGSGANTRRKADLDKKKKRKEKKKSNASIANHIMGSGEEDTPRVFVWGPTPVCDIKSLQRLTCCWVQYAAVPHF